MDTVKIIQHLRSTDDRLVDQAFTLIYQEYYPVIESFIKNNKGTNDDAADIFQDALVVFYHNIRKEGFELRCAIKTYIYSICRNLWLKKLNSKKQKLQQVESFDTVDIEPNIMEILEDTEQSKIVAQLLKEVGEDDQQLLIDIYFHGLNTKEITEKMGYASEYVTRNKKSRSIKKLREFLEKSPFFKDLLRK